MMSQYLEVQIKGGHTNRYMDSAAALEGNGPIRPRHPTRIGRIA